MSTTYRRHKWIIRKGRNQHRTDTLCSECGAVQNQETQYAVCPGPCFRKVVKCDLAKG